MRELRAACAAIAARATHVRIDEARLPGYAANLPLGAAAGTPEHADPGAHLLGGDREQRTAFWLTLDAVNFGSGWFPTLRKREGRSGYFTIAMGIRERFAEAGPWSARQLAAIESAEVAAVLGQDPHHELMALYARSLRDLGAHVAAEHGGRFTSVVDAAGGSAVRLAVGLGRWEAFADTSLLAGIRVPFLKRAQIAASDLHQSGLASFSDLDRLTMFADNLVPHVLRLDGVLHFRPELVARIDHGVLLEHDSAEEVEIRACALHAVELIVAARPEVNAAELDGFLWRRGQEPRYKAWPRHRARCTAY